MSESKQEQEQETEQDLVSKEFASDDSDPRPEFWMLCDAPAQVRRSGSQLDFKAMPAPGLMRMLHAHEAPSRTRIAIGTLGSGWILLIFV